MMERAGWMPERDMSPTPAADTKPREPIVVAWRRIVQEVAVAHGVSAERVFGRDRHLHVSLARRHAWWRIRQELHLSYPVIGALALRDHTTVMQQVKRFEVERSTGLLSEDLRVPVLVPEVDVQLMQIQHTASAVRDIVKQAQSAERMRIVALIERMSFGLKERAQAARIIAALR